VSDFEDRLAALDPAARQSYEHRDLDSLISRITTQPVRTKSRLWHNIELKVASTLIAASMVTAGAVAVFQGAGAGLPVLAIQSTSGAHAPKSAKLPTAGAMQIYEEFNFTAGPGLTAATPTSPSYELQIPSSGSDEAVRVAKVFGVSGSPVNTSGASVDWTVTSSSGSSLDYANSWVPEWSYAASPATMSTDFLPSDLPSQSTLAKDVQSYLAKLGYDYTLSAPSFGTTTSTSNTTTPGSTSTADVTYSVAVNGMSTDQYVSFSVDANNNVVNASGPAFSVGSSLVYPLQSLAAGVAALNVEQQSRYPATSPQASPPPTGTGLNAGGTNTSTTPAGPPIVDVTLNFDSLSLETYQLTGGSLWLLPVYDYTGVEANLDGSTSRGTWYELAVDPSYVHVTNSTTSGGTHGVINY
jgi:hypothetical protein